MAQTKNLTLLPRGSHASPFVELRQALSSRVADISPFVDQLMRFVRLFIDKFRDVDGSEVIEIAVHEALGNAVIHGNHENPHKDVYVTCRCTMDGEVSITVRDEGEGFDSRALPDPTDPDRRLLTHGRGIHLMRALMDEVCFEENGQVVRMRKRLRRPL